MSFEIITVSELIRRLQSFQYNELHVHCTATPDIANHWTNRPDGIYWQEAMQRVHMKERGWRDIGQHVTLIPDGLFVTGRDFSWTPASIAGYNTGAFAVEMFGHFDIGRDIWQGDQKENMIRLARFFDDRGSYIRFHNENSSKTCPGTSISKPYFMNLVKGGSTVVLRRGSRGDEVKKLQENLIKLGYSLPKYGADGIFGEETENVVKQFQKDNQLSVDGIVGQKTFEKIEFLLKTNTDSELEVMRLKKVIEEQKTEIANLKNKIQKAIDILK